MRQIGNEKYLGEDGGYTVYVAIEIKKVEHVSSIEETGAFGLKNQSKRIGCKSMRSWIN
jgi:hypothetical protein